MAQQKTANDQATARAARIGELKAQADEHEISGHYAKAASAHYDRGEAHLATGNHKAAADAFRAGMHAMGRHVEKHGIGSDCGWMRRGK